jgi:hypothetical protein
MSRLIRDSWLSYAWLTQASGQWADHDLAGASPTNGSPGLPLPLPYIYMCVCVCVFMYLGGARGGGGGCCCCCRCLSNRACLIS